MPVNYKQTDKDVLCQRTQYAKGGIARAYWDYKDKIIVGCVRNNANTILDAGCGEGIILERLYKLFPGKRVFGIDIDKRNISICDGFDFETSYGDLRSLDGVQDDSIDCCILSEVIEHITDIDAVFSEIKRILKKSGSLIVVFPNDFMMKLARIITFKFKEAFYDPGHVDQWTPKMLKRHLPI